MLAAGIPRCMVPQADRCLLCLVPACGSATAVCTLSGAACGVPSRLSDRLRNVGSTSRDSDALVGACDRSVVSGCARSRVLGGGYRGSWRQCPHGNTHRWFQADVRYVVPQELQLLVALVVLLAQMLVLLLQLPQLIRHPFLDPRGFRLDLPRVLKSELPLRAIANQSRDRDKLPISRSRLSELPGVPRNR